MAIESQVLEQAQKGQPESDYSSIRKNLLDIHAEQAERVFPRGTALQCSRSGCNHVEPVSPRQFASLALDGWPVHCGVTMQLGDAIDDVEVA